MPESVIDIFRRQVPAGSQVVIFLTNGREYSGIVQATDESSIQLLMARGSVTIFDKMIGGWEVMTEQPYVQHAAQPHPEPNGAEPFATAPALALAPDALHMSGVTTSDDGDGVAPPPRDDSADAAPALADASPADRQEPREDAHQNVQQVIIRIAEIKARYDVGTQKITLALPKIDFHKPLSVDDLTHAERMKYLRELDRASYQYNNALKIKELSRLLDTAVLVRNLTTETKIARGIRLLAGQLLLTAGRHTDARTLLEEEWRLYALPEAAYCAAVCSLELNDLPSACLYLNRYHTASGKIAESPEWFTLVGLIRRFKAFGEFENLIPILQKPDARPDMSVCLAEGVAYCILGYQPQEAAYGLVAGIVNETIGPEVITHALSALKQGTAVHPDATWSTFVQTEEAKTQKFKEALREEKLNARKRQIQSKLHLNSDGVVTFFGRDRKFGFVKDLAGNERWFHQSDIADGQLYSDLTQFPLDIPLEVSFEAYETVGKLRAKNLTYPDTVESALEKGRAMAKANMYKAACAALKPIIVAVPDHQEAKELYKQWSEAAQGKRKQPPSAQGNGLYEKAQRALQEKKLDEAERLLREAMQAGHNFESSVKALAMLLDQPALEQPESREKAIKLLEDNLSKINNKRPALNILVTLYSNVGRHPEAIKVLEKVKSLSKPSEVPNVLKRIALNYYKLQKYDEASRLLDQVLNLAPLDQTAARWKATLTEARETGVYTEADVLFDPGMFTEVSYETLSPTLKFALDRCDFAGVVDTVLATRNFTQTTVESVNHLLYKVERGRPRERARYLLTVARLLQEIGSEDYSRFRSTLFAYACSMGDSAASQHRPMDVVRAYYAEALFLGEQWDSMVNRVVQYIRSYVVKSEELLPIDGRSVPLDETLQMISAQATTPVGFWDGILDICLINTQTANYLLPRIEKSDKLRDASLEFLLGTGFFIKKPYNIRDYTRAWNDARQRRAKDYHEWFDSLRALSSTDLSAANCETISRGLEENKKSWLPTIDQARLSKTATIVNAARRLFMQIDFEERDRVYQSCLTQVDSIIKDIEDNPIRFAAGGIYPFLEWIKMQLIRAFEDVLVNTTPRVSVDLPIEQTSPDKNGRARLHVRVSNAIFCQPISNISLRLISDANECWPARSTFEYPDVIRGGDSGVVECGITLMGSAIELRAVSVGVALSYYNRKGEQIDAPVTKISLRLDPASEFISIEPNPFAPYVDGGPVMNRAMFFGRENDISNMANAIISSDAKCVVIYGQKRAGKSSVLYHLRDRLNESNRMLPVQITAGTVASKPSMESLLYRISQKLSDTLEELRNNGADAPMVAYPSFDEFHKDAVIVFLDFLRTYRREAARRPEWRERKLVLLIDEFTYLYTAIKAGMIPADFMKSWKALLEEGNFSAVLVGQDVMPRFKQEFANEFGVTSDFRLTYLPEAEAAKLLENPIRIGGPDGESRYRSKSLSRALELTKGSAYYAQMLGNRLVNYMNDVRATYITEADVDRVAASMVRGADALAKDKFDNLITPGDAVVNTFTEEETLAVLAAIARGSRGENCSKHALTEENLSNLELILKDLKDRDVIDEPLQDHYRIHVGLFQEWLLSHYGRSDGI